MRRTLIRIAYAVGLFILTILLLEIFQDKGRLTGDGSNGGPEAARCHNADIFRRSLQ